MKGKALRKHSLHEKTAASVLLKLFISCNAWNIFIYTFYNLKDIPWNICVKEFYLHLWRGCVSSIKIGSSQPSLFWRLYRHCWVFWRLWTDAILFHRLEWAPLLTTRRLICTNHYIEMDPFSRWILIVFLEKTIVLKVNGFFCLIVLNR